jgi:hypothetical protein
MAERKSRDDVRLVAAHTKPTYNVLVMSRFENDVMKAEGKYDQWTPKKLQDAIKNALVADRADDAVANCADVETYALDAGSEDTYDRHYKTLLYFAVLWDSDEPLYPSDVHKRYDAIIRRFVADTEKIISRIQGVVLTLVGDRHTCGAAGNLSSVRHDFASELNDAFPTELVSSGYVVPQYRGIARVYAEDEKGPSVADERRSLYAYCTHNRVVLRWYNKQMPKRFSLLPKNLHRFIVADAISVAHPWPYEQAEYDNTGRRGKRFISTRNVLQQENRDAYELAVHRIHTVVDANASTNDVTHEFIGDNSLDVTSNVELQVLPFDCDNRRSSTRSTKWTKRSKRLHCWVHRPCLCYVWCF